MKVLFKRGLTLLMVLALCVSLVSGLTLPASAATVNYVYDGSYVYNWGTRGETATFLSPMAEEWYTDQGASYSALSALSGSSSTASVSTSALYTELASLMADSHSTMTSYDGTRDLYCYADCVESNTSKISCFYTKTELTSSWDSGSTWNREHTWPNSKSDSDSDSITKRESDMHMLRATTVSSNSSRGNTPYGNSSGYYNPLDKNDDVDVRGDAARSILYIYVRYGTDSDYNDGALDYMWGADGVMESVAVLLEWMEEDPVDTWEMGHNDAVQSINGNRNVFVDYPELAFLLFAEDVPADYTTPSGGEASSYTITATSNNNSYGTVSLSGSTITATPNTGYYVDGYTVTSGSATVSQSGNTFRVSASSDCSVQINFAAKTAVTVTFCENGAVGSTINTYAGDAFTLPAQATETPVNHTFVGWVSSQVQDVTEKPTVLEVGSEQTVTANTDYYALYSYVESDGDSTGGSGDYEKVTTALADWSGTYLIVYEGGNVAFDGALTTFDSAGNTVAVTIADNTIQATDAMNAAAFTIAAIDGGYSIQGTSGKYFGQTTNANGLKTGDTAYTNTLSIGEGGVDIVSGGAYLRFNAASDQMRFRYYKTSSYAGQKAIQLYRKTAGGTTYYTTSTCEHANQEAVDAVAATCENGGYTAGVYCADCETYIDGHQPTQALGHSYDSVVTKPTATEQGYTTYTCSICGDTYESDYVDALGESHTVTFVVPEGVTAIKSMSCANAGIDLPVAEVPQGGAYEYIFAGWVKAEVDNSTVEPTIYSLSETFTTDADVTLYALYRYVVAGGSTEFAETDIANIGSTDDVVITMTYGDTVYALPNDGGTSTPSAVTVTVSEDKLSAEPAENLLWNIGGDASGYIFYPNGVVDTWLYCTNSNDGVRIGDNANNLFTIDAASGYLKHTATNRFVGVYLNNPDWRCYTSTTGNITNQTLRFFVRSSGAAYYTTVISAPAEEEKYILSFRVPNGVTQPDSVVGNGIHTLPTISDAEQTITIGATTYTFEGWVKGACNDATEKPSEVYAENGNYSLTENTVFYALYTYNVTEEVEVEGGEEAWTLVTDASTLEIGDQLVIAANTKDSVAGEISNQYMSKVASTFSTDKKTITTLPTAAVILTLGGTTDAWTLTNASGELLGATAVKKLAWGSGTTTWTITIDASNNATIYNTNQSYGRFLYNNSNPRFTTYTSNTSSSMLLPQIYRLEGGESGVEQVTTTYYTTSINGAAKITGSTLTLGATLGANFYVQLSEQYETDCEVEFSYYDYRTGKTNTVTVSLAGTTYNETYQAYVFTMSDLAAAEMSVMLDAKLIYQAAGEESIVLDMQEYSIRTYAMAIIGGDYTDEQKAAAKAMLNYGAWAQQYFGVNTGDLANKDLGADALTDTDTALAAAKAYFASGDLTAYKATVTNRLSGFMGYTLLLKDVTGLRLYFTEQVTVTVDGVAKTAVQDPDSNTRYYVEIDGVDAGDLDTTMTIVCGDMTISNLSVLSPAVIVAENTSKSENFRNTMIALILYAQSVNQL